MAETLFDLNEFEPPKKPRATPRKLMHVVDCGDPRFDLERAEKMDDAVMCEFKCGHCGYESDWIVLEFREAKPGIPCPKCNDTKLERSVGDDG